MLIDLNPIRSIVEYLPVIVMQGFCVQASIAIPISRAPGLFKVKLECPKTSILHSVIERTEEEIVARRKGAGRVDSIGGPSECSCLSKCTSRGAVVADWLKAERAPGGTTRQLIVERRKM